MPELPEGGRISNYQYAGGWHVAEPFRNLSEDPDPKGTLQGVRELLRQGREYGSKIFGVYLHLDEADDLLFVRITSRDPKAFLAALHRLRELGFATGSNA